MIEQLLSVCPEHIPCFFYRTAQGAEIDLVIEVRYQELIAIEIKKSSAPSVSKGFHIACSDIRAKEKYVVYAGRETFPMSNDVTAISVKDMMKRISRL